MPLPTGEAAGSYGACAAFLAPGPAARRVSTLSTDRYRTLAGSAAAEPPKTKGSRFIGEAFPAASEDEAAAWREGVRRREHAATHWCWACRLGAPGPLGDGARPRYSDDGEPGGSAGLPILREIDKRRLSDTLVVVTRYYGGTKLGVGGLARAYAEAAALALDAAPRAERVVTAALRLRFAFGDTAAAMHIVSRFGAEVVGQAYTSDGADLLVAVPRSQSDALRAAFADALGGRGEVGKP